MPIKNIKCPNCGGSIQIEDSLEKGYCMYCGGVIIVQDEVQKIKIEHSGRVELSGKVKIDDTETIINFLNIADQAFNNGNFREAYTYYNKILECDFNNWYATFKKALSASYMTHTRIFELEQAIGRSVELYNKKVSNQNVDIYRIFKESENFIKKTFFTRCNQDEDYEFSDIDEAQETFDIIAALTRLCGVCVDLITPDLMSKNGKLEFEKKSCIDLGICICKRGLSDLRYFHEYKLVQAIHGLENEAVYESLEPPYRDMHKWYLNRFKNDYNNLPSVVNAVHNYEYEKASLQRNRAAYDREIKKYFAAYPDKKNLYNRKAWPFVLIAFAWLQMSVFLFLFFNSWFVGLMVAMGFFALIILSIVKNAQYKKMRARISSEFPPVIKNLEEICKQNQIRLERAKSVKDSYMKNR